MVQAVILSWPNTSHAVTHLFMMLHYNTLALRSHRLTAIFVVKTIKLLKSGRSGEQDLWSILKKLSTIFTAMLHHCHLKHWDMLPIIMYI